MSFCVCSVIKIQCVISHLKYISVWTGHISNTQQPHVAVETMLGMIYSYSTRIIKFSKHLKSSIMSKWDHYVYCKTKTEFRHTELVYNQWCLSKETGEAVTMKTHFPQIFHTWFYPTGSETDISFTPKN